MLSQAMAWILVVGHAFNLGLNNSATSVYSLGIAASQLRERDPSAYKSAKSEVLTYDWKRLIKGGGGYLRFYLLFLSLSL
jgi:hypothetical protein